MKKEVCNTSKVYERPMVLNHQPIRFETAHSWNKGHGNRDHYGTGDDGANYPHPPFTGPQNGNGGGKGK